MKAKLHIISGLPRSGSTLLSALLSQNPAFHASMSSPVLGCIFNVRDSLNMGDRAAESLLSEADQLDLHRSFIEAYYKKRIRSSCQVIFDTNRSWSGNLHLLNAISSSSKVIACVRKMSEVVNSFEWQFRKSPAVLPKLFATPDQWATVYSRVDAMTMRAGVVGQPWVALKEGLYSNFSSKLLLVDYDLLSTSPLKTLECIYQFLGIEYWDGHDADNVELLAAEKAKVDLFDKALGAPDLHRLRPAVAKDNKQMLLPPDLVKNMDELNFWSDLSGSEASILKATD